MPLTAQHVYPAAEPLFLRHASRRSVVHSTQGMVSSTQPLASEAGQRILKMGGNAADAAVAVGEDSSYLSSDSAKGRFQRLPST